MSDPITYLYTFEVNNRKFKKHIVRILSENYETARDWCLALGEKHHITHIKSEVHRGPKKLKKKN